MTLPEIFARALVEVPISGISLKPVSEYEVQLLNEAVVISIDYDWRDRDLTATYRSVEDEKKSELAPPLQRIFDRGQSLSILLHKRNPATKTTGKFDIRIEEESVGFAERYLREILEFTPDVLTMTVPKEDQRDSAPPTIKVWGLRKPGIE